LTQVGFNRDGLWIRQSASEAIGGLVQTHQIAEMPGCQMQRASQPDEVCEVIYPGVDGLATVFG